MDLYFYRFSSFKIQNSKFKIFLISIINDPPIQIRTCFNILRTRSDDTGHIPYHIFPVRISSPENIKLSIKVKISCSNNLPIQVGQLKKGVRLEVS